MKGLSRPIQCVLALTIIATTLPIVSEYFMAFLLFVWLATGGRWRLALVSNQALPPVGDPERPFMLAYGAAVRPVHWGILALVATQTLAALLGCVFSEWGEPLGATLREWAHMTNRLGILWLIMSSSLLVATRLGWSPRRIAPWFLIWLVAHFLYCLVQRRTGIDLVHGLHAQLEPSRFAYGVYRISGFMGHPLTLAYNLMLAMLAALTLVLRHRVAPAGSRSAWVWWGIAAASAGTLLISGSRFVLIVTVLTLGLCEGRKVRRFWPWILGIGAVISGVLWVEGSLLGRVGELFDTNQPLLERFPRLMYWQMAWRMFVDHPLIGVSAIGRPRAAAAYYSAAGFHDNLYIAHNIFLQYMADTGLLGLAGLLAFFVGLGTAIHRLGGWAHSSQGLGYLTAATVLSGLMQNNLLDSSFLDALWFFLSLLLVQSALQAAGPQEPDSDARHQRKSPKNLQSPAGRADSP